MKLEIVDRRGLNRLLFEREAVPSFGIAPLAAGDQISFGGLASPDNGNQMVHGELSRWKLSAAVMTNAAGALALPPLAGTNFLRLLALAPNLLFADFYEKRCRLHGGHQDEKIMSTTV